MALQTANQFNLTPANQFGPALQASREGTQRLAQGKQVMQQNEQVILQNEQKIAANRAAFLGESIASVRALPQELRAGAVEQLTPRLAELGIPADQFRGADLSDNALDQALASVGAFQAQAPAEQFTLSPGQTRFQGTQPIASVAPKAVDPTKEADTELRRREIALKEKEAERRTTKLSAGLEKALLESQDAVIEAQRNSSEFDILANQVETADLAGGLQTSTSETLKKLLGSQDDVTELRRRFNAVRLSQGLRNLPPGPATDRDMQEAFKGVPPENAPGSQIASFLRGVAKMARFDAGYNQFKSDFISENSTSKGLNKEWRKSVTSSVLGRDVTIAEIYAEAAAEGMTPEDVKAELGIE